MKETIVIKFIYMKMKIKEYYDRPITKNFMI